MDDYSLEIKPSALKDLEGLPDNILRRVVAKLEALAQNPRPAGCKKLKGFRDQWRIRAVDWRAIYIVDDGGRTVSITRIAHRREVYE